MADSLAHRGPDGEGVWIDGTARAALAHRRLAIIDLSLTGAQPMQDASGRYTISYNGEIYNYRELREGLEAKGVAFRGTSDTEVLLELFAHEGDHCIKKLNGIFAFAIWDAETGVLFLARDALGVKPLYFSEHPKYFLFASELKSLTPFIDQRTLDAAAIDRYLTFLWCPGEGTPIQAVRKLGPGEALWVQQGHIIKRITWYRLPTFQSVDSGLSSANHLRFPLVESETINETRNYLR
jgi:asparagine synthase (glutamine-hydrolysing)